MNTRETEILAILQQLPLFHVLTPPNLKELAAHVEACTYPPGARLILEGTYGSRVIILYDGQVVILKRIGNTTTELARPKAITILGEMALLEGGLRSATVRAATPVRVLELTKEGFNHLMRAHPSLALTIVRELSTRLRQTDSMVIEGLIACNKEMGRSQRELERACNATLAALRSAFDLRDTETEDHSRRVARIALIIGQEMGLTPDALKALWRGAMLQDVGKIGVPNVILRKDGPLTADERKLMSHHPEWGVRILGGIEFLADALPVALHHHEWFDGSGYPRGLSRDNIPLGARIFALADVYDALTSDRPYRPAFSYSKARTVIEGESGTHFDPEVVAAFQRAFPRIVAALGNDGEDPIS